MSSITVTVILAITLAMAVAGMLALWRGNRNTETKLSELNSELIAVSGDSSVGRRLPVSGNGEIARLAETINRLFDALGERDEEIQGREKLFMDFARTLPEIVLVHEERILFANDSAAALVGLPADQLEGRDVADLVKPAYRALFRKSINKRLSGEAMPRRL
ncbi:MAG: PAS domain S-box protein, partial [Woeseiaceae bacterium]